MEENLMQLARNLSGEHSILSYIFYFFNSIVQILFPPYPGDSVIVLGGYLASKGIMDSKFLILDILMATYASSVFLYIISYKYGDKITSNKIISRYFDLRKISKLEKWFKKYGSIAIIINKFIPGVGSLTLIAAGIFKLRPSTALISIGIASIIHNIILFMSGKITGDNMVVIKRIIGEYNKYIIIAVPIILGIYVYVKYFSKRKKEVA